MDVNKLEKLRKIDYVIQPSCLTCQHANFRPNTNWGICLLHTYKHAKHTEEQRQLSIFKTGICYQYVGNFVESHWEEFLGK